MNTKILLNERPVGEPNLGYFRTVKEDIVSPKEGEDLVISSILREYVAEGLLEVLSSFNGFFFSSFIKSLLYVTFCCAPAPIPVVTLFFPVTVLSLWDFL